VANYKEFLQGKSQQLDYYDYPLGSLVEYWRKRWLINRRNKPEVKEAVLGFRRSEFVIG
jgi:hypothetical protein